MDRPLQFVDRYGTRVLLLSRTSVARLIRRMIARNLPPILLRKAQTTTGVKLASFTENVHVICQIRNTVSAMD
jgi:hypothetical protein